MTARAALRATARDLANLHELLDAMSMGVTADHYARLDQAFHQAIAQPTHNQLLHQGDVLRTPQRTSPHRAPRQD